MAVQITHIRSNRNRTQFERTRMLFDFVRAAFAGPRTACTDLSRRLRDGVSLENELPSSGTPLPRQIYTTRGWPAATRLAAEKHVHYQRFHAKLTL
jgi:hypothetical protein